ncbi:MAG: hypothetical protein DRG35_05090 [Deltaproteobacteria bacterium]|nr:MAG: hypothetical protein DRG35_05090 [Deltaproteobacteria bacterium]
MAKTRTVIKYIYFNVTFLAIEGIALPPFSALFFSQKFTNCKNTPSPLMREGWGDGAPSPLSPSTRGGEISVFIDVQLSVCNFLLLLKNLGYIITIECRLYDSKK